MTLVPNFSKVFSFVFVGTKFFMFAFNWLCDILLSTQFKTSGHGCTHTPQGRGQWCLACQQADDGLQFRVWRSQWVCFRGTGEYLNPVSQLNGGRKKALYTWGMAGTCAGWGSEHLFSLWQITFLSRFSQQCFQVLIRAPFSPLIGHVNFQLCMLKSRNRFLN